MDTLKKFWLEEIEVVNKPPRSSGHIYTTKSDASADYDEDDEEEDIDAVEEEQAHQQQQPPYPSSKLTVAPTTTVGMIPASEPASHQFETLMSAADPLGGAYASATPLAWHPLQLVETSWPAQQQQQQQQQQHEMSNGAFGVDDEHLGAPFHLH